MGTQVSEIASTTAIEPAPDQTPRRHLMMAAFSTAEQIVSQLHAVPTDVDVHSDLVGVYRIRLYFSQDRAGVLEFARTFDAEVVGAARYTGAGEYFEARTRHQGIDVVAWSILGGEPVEDDQAPAAEDDTAPAEAALAEQAVEA